MAEENIEHLAERPAANTRSPNRQPRWRSPTRDLLHEKEQETFLRAYVLLGWQGACAAINRSTYTVWRWAQGPEHIEFRRRWGEAKVIRQQLLEPRMDDMTDASLKVVEGILANDDPKAQALALDAAKAHLKGTGVYSDKSRLELEGKDGVPLSPTFIFVLPDGTRKTAKEMLDGSSDPGK